jgi:hypothetical protein
MTPPSCFYFGKIKTVKKHNNRHFVFMHHRPSSGGLLDAPSQRCEEQNEPIKFILIGCNILHKEYYITFIPFQSSLFL